MWVDMGTGTLNMAVGSYQAFSANSAVPAEILELLSNVAIDGYDTPSARALRENLAIPDATKGSADALRM